MNQGGLSYRRWMLWAGPAVLLLGWRQDAAGAAPGLLIWMALGLFLRGQARLPYGRRRRLPLHRLFLGYGGAFAALCALRAGAARLFPPAETSRLLIWMGIAGPALILGQWMLSLRLPRGVSWAAGTALCGLAWLAGHGG